MSRKIVVTSGKGGVGKTSIVANLGAHLSDYGKKVVVLDTDFGLNNLDVVLGVEDCVVFDIIDVIQGKCRLNQALIQHHEKSNLFILPSAHMYDKSDINAQNIKIITDKLSNFDFILIDCPAGVEKGFMRSVGCANEAIIVTTPHISSIRDANKALSILRSFELKNIQLVINRVRGDLVINEKMMSVEDIVSLFPIDILGVLPESDEVAIASSIGQAVNSGAIDRAYYLLAQNLICNENYIFDCMKNYKGLLGAIKRTLKSKI